MEVVILIIILLVCPIYFGLKAHVQYGGIFSRNAGWGCGSYIALLLLIAYCIFISVIGKDQFFTLCSYACKIRLSYIYEPILLIIPSVGFSLVMYPYVGSEFFKSHSAINMLNMGWLVSFIGWCILIGLLLILLVP